MRLKIPIWHDTHDGKHKTVFRREEPSDHINAYVDAMKDALKAAGFSEDTVREAFGDCYVEVKIESVRRKGE